MEKLADALPVERAASRWTVSDDPDEHIERIAPYIELGFTHLVFHAPGPDQDRFLRLRKRDSAAITDTVLLRMGCPSFSCARIRTVAI
jgi:hypothetical protein